MKKLLLSFVFTALTCIEIFAYSQLYITDPREGWGHYPANIDDAQLHVIPKGTYFINELTLTVSEQQGYHTENDTLEIVYEFSLPEGSKIYESCLWIEDSMVQAELRDLWTAQAIYEGIVQRRKDPSILTKINTNQYMLRVFPLPATKSRKFRISYLTPGILSNNQIINNLPINMLTAADDHGSKLIVTTPKNEKYGQPFLPNRPSNRFFPLEKDNQEMWKTEFEFNIDDYADQMVFNFRFKNGLYLSVFQEKENEGYYQLAILPEIAVKTKAPKKLLVLLDYDEYTTTYSKNDIIMQLKRELFNRLSENDSIMLMHSSLNIQPIYDRWVSADSLSIEALFANISENKITNYSNLPSLLAKALSIIEDPGETEILLLSSSINQGASNTANNLFNDLKDLNATMPVIHTLSFCNRNLKYFYQGNRHYVGNEYFYMLLSRNTEGTMHLLEQQESIEHLLSQALLEIKGRIYSPDLYTSANEGFCFKRFEINLFNGAYAQQPIIQVGRYYGTPPFDITFSGVYEETPFSEHVKIDQTDIFKSDSTLRQFWAGEDILMLENQVNNGSSSPNEWIQEIIATSMSYQVLSRYTAFLALEPGMDPEVNPDENQDTPTDDDWMVDIDDPLMNENPIVTLKPNPFIDHITIEINLPDSLPAQEIQTIKIVDAMGKLVKSFNPDEYNKNQSFELEWQGNNMEGDIIKPGIYILIIEHKQRILTRKLLKQ